MKPIKTVTAVAIALLIVASGSVSAISFGGASPPSQESAVPDAVNTSFSNVHSTVSEDRPTTSGDDGHLVVISRDTGERYIAPEGTVLSKLSLPPGKYRVIRAAGTDHATEKMVSIGSDGKVAKTPQPASSSISLAVTTAHNYDWVFSNSGTLPIIVSATTGSQPKANVPITVEIRNNNYDLVATLSGTTNQMGLVRFKYDLNQLPSGEYNIEVKSSATTDDAWSSFIVGPAAKMAPKIDNKFEVGRTATIGLQVLNGINPVANVDRTVIIETPSGETITKSVTTNGDGYATISFTPNEAGGYQVRTKEGHVRSYFWVQDVIGRFEEITYSHQPGEKIHVGGYLLDDKQPLEGASITAVVTYEENESVYKNITTTTSTNGILSISFRAPNQESDLNVRLFHNGKSLHFAEYISINEYSTTPNSEYNIDVRSLSDYDDTLAPGETAPTKILVTHNGGPVANQQVNVSSVLNWDVPVAHATVTTNEDGVAYYNYTLPSDFPVSLFGESSLNIRAQTSINGTHLGDSAYFEAGQYKMQSQWSYNIAPGENAYYNVTVTDALTGEPISNLPISVMASATSFGHSSTFYGTVQLTNADGEASIAFTVPTKATGRVSLYISGSSRYATIPLQTMETSLEITGNLTSGGEMTISYATNRKNTKAIAFVINESNTQSVTAVRQLSESQDVTVQLPTVSEVTYLQVDMRIVSAEGYTASLSEWVEISPSDEANSRPTASFTYSPSSPTVGDSVTFNASASTDYDGTITKYGWDFNNDGTLDAMGLTATHTFTNPGDHSVTLAVLDNDGASDTVTKTVSVGAATDAIIRLRPHNATATTNSSLTLDIVLDSAYKKGVGAFDNITVSVNASNVAKITSITSPVSAAADTYVSTNGGSAAVKVPFGGNTPDNGVVVLGTVTLRAVQAGTVDMEVTLSGNIADEGGALYNVSATKGGIYSVTAGPPPVVGNDTPTNTDTDAALEDLNGNGALDIGDVQAMFAHRKSDAVQNNAAKFDFNNNGQIDIGDVQALFVEYRNAA